LIQGKRANILAEISSMELKALKNVKTEKSKESE
jgi:hypothetical protein